MLTADHAVAGDLQPPGPPGPTMKTLQEIYDQQSATHQIVESFVPLESLSDTTTVVRAGYYTTTNLVAVDVDLVDENIKKDVTLFGITGIYDGDNSTIYTAAVPKTGQVTSYSPGDDGDLQRGVPWPNPRFTDNADGTVTDNLTGLIWLKNANAFGAWDWTDPL